MCTYQKQVKINASVLSNTNEETKAQSISWFALCRCIYDIFAVLATVSKTKVLCSNDAHKPTMKNDNQIVIKPETIKASAPIKLLLCNKLMAVLWLRSKKSNYIQW